MGKRMRGQRALQQIEAGNGQPRVSRKTIVVMRVAGQGADPRQQSTLPCQRCFCRSRIGTHLRQTIGLPPVAGQGHIRYFAVAALRNAGRGCRCERRIAGQIRQSLHVLGNDRRALGVGHILVPEQPDTVERIAADRRLDGRGAQQRQGLLLRLRHRHQARNRPHPDHHQHQCCQDPKTPAHYFQHSVLPLQSSLNRAELIGPCGTATISGCRPMPCPPPPVPPCNVFS
ncbi:hypothetical protein D3C81_813970 [compost metagenome]